MNKRIRKKQIQRTLHNLVAACDEYEAARERVFREALQDVTDSFGKPREVFSAAFRRYLEVVSVLAFTGPPPV